ncbi:MAG: hypothetical protein RIB93_27200 [Coleofasciculus sp. D1-CHI-01]
MSLQKLNVLWYGEFEALMQALSLIITQQNRPLQQFRISCYTPEDRE